MKQTAIDFIVKELDILHRERKEKVIDAETFFKHKEVLIKEAKEMEKEQAKTMYNEEELKSAFKTGFNIGYGSPVSELDLKEEHCTRHYSH